jgi:hypothetical protein
VYLARIEAQHGLTRDQMNTILRSHLIDPDLLRADDFAGFIADRKRRLSDLAARAMGLPTVVAVTAEPEVSVGEPEGID